MDDNWYLQFFRYDHLRPDLQEISRPFNVQALRLLTTVPPNPERTEALKLLVRAKDCAVRAYLASIPTP